MKQPEDTKTMDLELAEKRGRGRPAKPDALTGAERAKRFRDAHRQGIKKALVDSVTENKETVTLKEFEELKRAEATRTMHLMVAHAELRLLTEKMAELQMKFDLEHLARIEAENRLKNRDAKKPVIPLGAAAAQINPLSIQVANASKIISAQNHEMQKLRDEITKLRDEKPSRKIAKKVVR